MKGHNCLQALVPEIQQKLPRLLFLAVDHFPLANGDGLDGSRSAILIAVRSLPCSERLDNDTKEIVKATVEGRSKSNAEKRQLRLSCKMDDDTEMPVLVNWHDAYDCTRLALKGAPSCTEAIALSADPTLGQVVPLYNSSESGQVVPLYSWAKVVPLYSSSEWSNLCNSIRQEASTFVRQKPYLMACVGPAQAVLHKAQKSNLTDAQIGILVGLCKRVVMRCEGLEKLTDTVAAALSKPHELSLDAWQSVVNECKDLVSTSSQQSLPVDALKNWVTSVRDFDFSVFSEVCCKSVTDPLPSETSIPVGPAWEGLLENAVPAGAELVFATQVGSFMYDLHVASSDSDFAILFLADAKDLLAPQPPRMEFQHHVNLGFGADKQGLLEYTSREFGSFCAELAKGNPRNVELLFTEKPQARNWVWDELRARRKGFLTIHCARQYLGFIQDRLKRVLKECDDTSKFCEDHAGRASKLLYHAHHRILELQRIVRGDEPAVALTGDELLRVMRFRLHRPQDVEEVRNHHREADTLWQQLRVQIDAVEEKKALPKEVNAESLLAWLCSVRTRQIAWRNAKPAKSLAGSSAKEMQAPATPSEATKQLGYGGSVAPLAVHSVEETKTSNRAQVEDTHASVEANDAVAHDAIKTLLEHIEAMENVRILWAGYGLSSRVLGTNHASSDHDVKAIFVHREHRYFGLKPLTHALRHKFPVEVGNGQVEVDISGWEARHACQLLSNNNPTVINALRSPVVFRSSPWVERLLSLHGATANWEKVSLAWSNHARGNFRQNILVVDLPVRKKYVHVLQALLCRLWLKLRSAASPGDVGWPPLQISVLLDQVSKAGFLSDAECTSVSSLLSAKEDLPQAMPHDKDLDVLIERLIASSQVASPPCIPTLQRQRSSASEWDELCAAMVSATSKF